jgi:predicted RNA-binding Zn ribbon-like protein
VEPSKRGTLEIGANPGPAGIELVGGALCLDFANTVEGREGPNCTDFIRTPQDLILWAQRAGALSIAEADSLAAQTGPRLQAVARSFAHALSLREAMYRIFTAIARDMSPDPRDLEVLRQRHEEGIRHAQLVPEQGSTGRYTWRWETTRLDVVHWRASVSAVDLLQSGRLDRLRQCPGGGDDPCNWLFVDTTRGGNRRWCSMSDCGGRAKWRRQNARRKKR